MATRLNINVSDDTARLLKEMATRDETSVTEIVRRAVGIYKYVDDGVRSGKDVRIIGDGEDVRLAIVR